MSMYFNIIDKLEQLPCCLKYHTKVPFNIDKNMIDTFHVVTPVHNFVDSYAFCSFIEHVGK